MTRRISPVFGQLSISRLHLVEQPGVLDGDDGLVGKSSEQLNLPLRIRHGFRFPKGERAHRFTVA